LATPRALRLFFLVCPRAQAKRYYDDGKSGGKTAFRRGVPRSAKVD